MNKYFSFLLLALLSLQGQGQTVTKYPVTTGQQFGMVVVKSSKAPAKAPLIVFLHGIGGRGKGTSVELDKLVGELPAEFKAGVEKYGFIAVAVQSDAAFTLNEPGFARNWAFKNLPVDTTRKYLTGLSWGGGGTGYFIKLSEATARLFDAAAPIAMTWQVGSGFQYVAGAKLPLWIFHNLKDPNGGTPVAASTGYYDSVASWKPAIPATITLFNRDIHGGWGEAYNPDKIPMPAGSQGTIAPAVNLFEWFLLNSSSTRTPVPVFAPPSTEQTAVISYTVTGNKVNLDARGSSNYKSVEWTVTGRPGSVSPWASLITGAMWQTATGTFPEPGTYTIELTTYANANYSGTTRKASVTVTVGTAPPDLPKVVASYDLVRKVVTFMDGSIETIASAVYELSKLKLTIVTDKGGTYTF